MILACREDGRALIERVTAADNLIAPPDLVVLLDMIYGPLFFRLLAGHQPLDRALPGAIVETAFAALTPSPSGTGRVASRD